MPFRPGLLAAAAIGIALLVSGCSEGEPAASGEPVPIAGPAQTETAKPVASALPEGTGFDFYVLALSWSPSYCALNGERADRRQCGRDGPDGFVVHGLWPQYKRGYPADCASGEPDRVPRQLLSAQRGLFPTEGLAAYEWRKHGTCSGLSQADYFATVRAARERVRIPPSLRNASSVSPVELENAFAAANRGLARDAMAVDCDAGLVTEIRICLGKDLAYAPCPEVDKAGCRATRLKLP